MNGSDTDDSIDTNEDDIPAAVSNASSAEKCDNAYVENLKDLIKECLDSDPTARPTIDEICQRNIIW